MIPCSMANLEQRCRQRGKTLDEVRACIVSQVGDAIVVDERHPAYPRAAPNQITAGAGTELKALLSKVGITASPTCSCNTRARFMDEKGIAWCEENVETICDWLQEEATKRKLPFVRLAGKALIHMAIRRAKKGTNK